MCGKDYSVPIPSHSHKTISIPIPTHSHDKNLFPFPFFSDTTILISDDYLFCCDLMHHNNFGNFYTREIYAIPIPIGFIPIPIPMGFPWEYAVEYHS